MAKIYSLNEIGDVMKKIHIIFVLLFCFCSFKVFAMEDTEESLKEFENNMKDNDFYITDEKEAILDINDIENEILPMNGWEIDRCEFKAIQKNRDNIPESSDKHEPTYVKLFEYGFNIGNEIVYSKYENCHRIKVNYYSVSDKKLKNKLSQYNIEEMKVYCKLKEYVCNSCRQDGGCENEEEYCDCEKKDKNSKCKKESEKNELNSPRTKQAIQINELMLRYGFHNSHLLYDLEKKCFRCKKLVPSMYCIYFFIEFLNNNEVGYSRSTQTMEIYLPNFVIESERTMFFRQIFFNIYCYGMLYGKKKREFFINEYYRDLCICLLDIFDKYSSKDIDYLLGTDLIRCFDLSPKLDSSLKDEDRNYFVDGLFWR